MTLISPCDYPNHLQDIYLSGTDVTCISPASILYSADTVWDKILNCNNEIASETFKALSALNFMWVGTGHNFLLYS